MCANPNTTPANPDNFHDTKAVFDQANNWARNVNSSIWLITSFFISLNLIVIETVLSNSENSHVKYFLGDLTCGQQILLAIMIFVALWLIPAVTALILMVISKNLYSFVKSRVPFTPKYLSIALTLAWPEVSQNEDSQNEDSQNPESSLSTFENQILKKPTKSEIFIKVLKTIKTPFGLIIASFTVLFGLVWLWIFPCLISKAA